MVKKEVKREQAKVRNRPTFLFVILAFIITFSINWFKVTFSDVSLEQLLFHLKVPLEGSNMDFIFDYFNWMKDYIIYLIFFIVCIMICQSRYFNHSFLLEFHFRVKSKKYVVSWKVQDLNYILYHFSLFIFLCSIVYLIIQLDIISFVKNSINTSNIYEEYYVNPKETKLTFPENKQNLVYIFSESMESSFASLDKNISSQQNLIPNLEKIALDNTHFSNSTDLGGAYTLSGTTWTVAGMVAQTSGVPVNVPISSNSFNQYSSFLPGVYSLGDILEKEGYHQYLMLGSDKSFGGRANYFKSHGNYDIFDYNTAKKEKKIADDYYVWWGYEDQKLFEYAKEKLNKLAKEDEPFNLTILTADTHFPDGYLDNTCENISDNQYANVVYCSDQKIAEFIAWIQEQDFYDNTTIIISGDHLLMGNYFFSNNYSKVRTVYNAIINPRVSTENTKNRIFTTLDMFPTTLAALGVDIEENRLGLGTNLFSDKKTLSEQLGLDYFNNELKKKSTFYNKKLLYYKKK